MYLITFKLSSNSINRHERRGRMVQQVAVRTPDEQRPPRKPSGRADAAIPDLIAAARRRLLAGAGARLRTPVVGAQWNANTVTCGNVA